MDVSNGSVQYGETFATHCGSQSHVPLNLCNPNASAKERHGDLSFRRVPGTQKVRSSSNRGV